MWKLFGVTGLLLLLTACYGDNDPIPQIDCSTINCTDEFIVLSVKVRDRFGVKIPLDDFEVIDLRADEDITVDYTAEEFADYRLNGQYPLYGDEFAQPHQKTSRKLVFTGLISGEEVVTAKYIVSADCCHVNLLAGDTTLILLP